MNSASTSARSPPNSPSSSATCVTWQPAQAPGMLQSKVSPAAMFVPSHGSRAAAAWSLLLPDVVRAYIKRPVLPNNQAEPETDLALDMARD